MTQIIVFTKYHDIKKIDNHSFRSKYSFLASFYYDLDEFSKFKPQKEKTEEKKLNMYLVNIRTWWKHNLMNAMIYLMLPKRSKMDPKYDPASLAL